MATGAPTPASIDPTAGSIASPANHAVSTVDGAVTAVHATASLADAISPPIFATTSPVHATVSLADATSTPADVALSSLDATASPVDATVSPTDAATSPTDAATSRVDAAVSSLDDAVSLVPGTVSPAHDTVSPAQVTVSPVDATVSRLCAAASPVDGTGAVVDEAVSPVDETVSPAHTAISLAHTAASPVEPARSPTAATPSPVAPTLALLDKTSSPTPLGVGIVLDIVHPAPSRPSTLRAEIEIEIDASPPAASVSEAGRRRVTHRIEPNRTEPHREASIMKTAPRWIVVFPPAEQVPQYIVDCRLVVKGMTDNPHFPSPTPPLAEVTAHLAALEACEHDAQRGGEDATAQRNAALALVERDMRLLKAHVQNVADGHPHAEAQAIITSAGMGVKKKVVRAKPPVAAKHGNIPGRVVLRAKALPAPVQYRWQWSTDQTSWIDLPETFRAECTLDGLTPATIVYFRLRTMTRHGLGEWSQTVSIIVH